MTIATHLTLRNIVFTVLILGMLLLIYSFFVPRYTQPGIAQHLSTLQSHDEFYKLQHQYATNKLRYCDIGSGLIVAAMTFLLFMTTTGIDNFTDFKNVPSLSVGQVFGLANVSVLMLVPGTCWYYIFRSMRGDYPSFADTISIPIMELVPVYFFLLFPMNIFLLIATYKAKLPVRLFATFRKGWKAVLWEIVFGFLLLLTTFCLVATIFGGDHFFVFTCISMIYVLLSLRAGKLSNAEDVIGEAFQKGYQ